MGRKRGELVLVGEAIADLLGPVQKLRATPWSGTTPLRSGEPACRSRGPDRPEQD